MQHSMDECIENCFECHQVCLESLQYCLDKGGDHSDPTHLRLLQNCASICETAAQFMISGSPQHDKVCELTAEVAKECAENCDTLTDDQQMRLCGEICRDCAESCEEMSRGQLAA